MARIYSLGPSADDLATRHYSSTTLFIVLLRMVKYSCEGIIQQSLFARVRGKIVHAIPSIDIQRTYIMIYYSMWVTFRAVVSAVVELVANTFIKQPMI